MVYHISKWFLTTVKVESTLLYVQIVLFTEHFSSPNFPWSQHVWISDFQLYMPLITAHCIA